MAIWLATGPPGITCEPPSTVVTSVKPWKFWITPWLTRIKANTKHAGSRIRVVVRVRSTQKLPSVDARRRASPRMNAAKTAMPAAAETKLWTASPSIWLRWLIVASPLYDCQFVLVEKLTAVLNERCSPTAGMLVGLNGKESWMRSCR